jgi:hypothetical protein
MATTCTFTSRDAAAFAQRIKDSESAESVEARTSRYYQYLEDSEASKIPVINTKTRAGTDISLLIKMPPSLTGNLGDVSNISGDLASEWGCSTCVRRLHTLRNFVGADGKAVFCRLAHPCRTDLQAELNGKCEKIISEFNKRYGADFRWDFEIVTTETIFKPFEKSGKGCDWEKMGQYRHYSYVPTSVTGDLSTHERIWIPKALTKYSPLISNLLSKIGSIGNMITSCNILTELLNKATYAKNQIPAIKWFIDLLNKAAVIRDQWDWIPFNERLAILADVICKSSITEGDSGSAHIGFFHTINGFILDIIENGKSPEGVVKMLEERNSPDKYRRKTGEAKEGHIQAAEKLIGAHEHPTMVETISELESHSGCVKIISKPPVATPATQTSSGAFAQMRASNKKSSKYGGFASRMTENEPSKAHSFSEIMEDIASGKISKVEISTKNLETLYTAKTPINDSDLAFGSLGHLWSFGGRIGYDRTASGELVWKPRQIYGGYGYGGPVTTWYNVTHIYPFKTTKHHAVLFAIENSHHKSHSIKGNCLFPEFFAPKHRAAEKAIEKLNTMTRISIPSPTTPISYGVGSSVGFVDGKLTTPVTIRITSGSKNVQREIKITHI